MLRLIAILLCGVSALASEVGELDQAMEIMKRYCAACHAIEPLRFVVSDSNETNWRFIHENKPPGEKKSWAERIVELTDWPVADPKQLKDPQPPYARWMPIGQKRYGMTQQMVDERNARQFFVDVLRKYREDE